MLIVRRLKSWCPRAGLKSERFMHVKPPHALMELHRGKQYITLFAGTINADVKNDTVSVR